MIDDAAVMAAENFFEYPFFSIGIGMDPNAEVSATAEPETAKEYSKVFTCASPPRRCPIMVCESQLFEP